MWIQLYMNSVTHYTISYDDLGITGLEKSRKKIRDINFLDKKKLHSSLNACRVLL